MLQDISDSMSDIGDDDRSDTHDLASLFECVLFGESESNSSPNSSSYEYDLVNLLGDEEDKRETAPSDEYTAHKRHKPDSDPQKWTEMAPDSCKKKKNEFSFSETPGPTQYAREHIDSSALSAFLCLFDDTIIDQIVTNTNAKARASNSFEIVKLDLLRLVSVVLARALFSEHIPVRNMWSVKFGVPYIAKFMSKNRYMKIMSHLRFDNTVTRAARAQQDSFAMMREVNVWFRCGKLHFFAALLKTI